MLYFSYEFFSFTRRSRTGARAAMPTSDSGIKSPKKNAVCAKSLFPFFFSVELQQLKSYDCATQVQARDELEPGRAGAVGYCSTTKGGGQLQFRLMEPGDYSQGQLLFLSPPSPPVKETLSQNPNWSYFTQLPSDMQRMSLPWRSTRELMTPRYHTSRFSSPSRNLLSVQGSNHKGYT